MGEEVFDAIALRAKRIGFIDPGVGKKVETLERYTRSLPKDAAMQRAEVILQNYKNMVPSATGQELKLGLNNLGEFDINQLLIQDDFLKNYLVKDGKVSNLRRQTILKQLHREGILKKLGLDKFYLAGSNPKVVGTDDPKLQQFLIDLAKRVKFGIREGKTVDEIFNSFQKQINDPDFYEKVVPLILKKVQLQDKIRYNREKFGLDIDDLHISHKEAVVDNIDTTFKLSNIFIGKAKLNRKEVALKNKIRNLQSILKQKGGKRLFLSEEAEENIKREIQDTEFELEHGGYYDPIEEGFEEQMDQALSQSAFGSSFVFADGGFATMEDVLGYSNE
jgi:hypothetical protein